VNASKSIQRVAFLLLPRFSLVALSAAVEVLEQANVAFGERLFTCTLLSPEGTAVKSGSGISVQVEAGLQTSLDFDAVFVISDAPLPQQGDNAVLAWLQSHAAYGATAGGIGTGGYLLARAGLLSGYRATIHWPYAGVFAENFPDTIVSSNLFEIDRERLTAAGGNASFDMMLAWIAARHGDEIVAELMDHFGHERQRASSEHQRVPLAARIGGGQPKLTEAVSLMEANYEEPLPTEEIARLVGVSRRQLERLFKQYLNSLPSRYYLELRLNRARHLLQQTSQSILQIGLSCGFSSGPHFSSAYRNHFGITPRDQRTQRMTRAGDSEIASNQG
jgi:AraC family transcriptional regulator, L-arginine-responsive activator